jgi:nucleoside-diphosphate-sugar epimerase
MTTHNTSAPAIRRVLVTGGGGYVGSALVPALLADGYDVDVVDLFWYGREVLADCADHPRLRLIEMDIRDAVGLRGAMTGADAVIHLACISNDPSFELDPALGKSINYDAFAGILDAAVACRVRRFIYASSSSIYGVKDTPDVREDAVPEPLTDYSRFKLACERDLLAHPNPHGMERVILRPATVCGYAPRLRLDLTVNILTIHALVNRRIRVFGGRQLRPNLNMADMVRAYRAVLAAPAHLVDGQAFNVGHQNLSVDAIAELVRSTLGDPGIAIVREPTNDLRSYHVNADRIRDVLGFRAEHTVEEAVLSLAAAFAAGHIPDPMTATRYHNVQVLKARRLA